MGRRCCTRRSTVADHVPEDQLYGLLAEFESAEDLLRAAERQRARLSPARGHTPFHVDGLAETQGSGRA
jgi:hypothetical protein